MTDTIALYYKTFKALEDMALVLADNGMTDAPAYKDYVAYRQGYELARAELLESLGFDVK